MARPIDDFYAVIPAGGVGSRLWPLSRADAPKFLHDLTGSGHSLLRDTWDRLAPLSGEDRIAVVTGRAHRAARFPPFRLQASCGCAWSPARSRPSLQP